MKLIQLTQGKVAIVDDDMFEELNKYRWIYHHGYAERATRIDGKQKIISMHRVIMNATDGLEVDHVNFIRSDNRRENLRLCTQAENKKNKKLQKNNKTGIKGVRFDKQTGKFIAAIGDGGKTHYLGCFEDIESASQAYETKAKELFGEFASKGLEVPMEIDKNLVAERAHVNVKKTTDYIGVYYNKQANLFHACIRTKEKNKLSLGLFRSLNAAAAAYNEAAIKYRGEHAKLNIIKAEKERVIVKSPFKNHLVTSDGNGSRVSFNPRTKKYFVYIKGKYSSRHDTVEEATDAYNQELNLLKNAQAQ